MTNDSIERPFGWVIVWVSVAIMLTGAGGTYLTIVGMKPIAADLGWPRSVPSLAYSLAIGGMGLGGIVLGRWSDKVGAAWPAVIAGVSIALGSLVIAHTRDEWVYLAAHGVLIGFFGNGALFAPLLANITRWFDRRRGIAIATAASGQGLGGALWPPLFRYGIETWGWPTTFTAFAIVCVTIVVPLAFVLRATPPAPLPEILRKDADGRVLGLPSVVVLGALSLAIVGCCIAMAMPIVHVVAHATDLGHSAARAAELLSLLLASAFVGRLFWGAMCDRLGGLKTLFLGVLGQGIVLFAYLGVENLIGLYIVSILFGFAFGGVIPSYTIVVRDLYPASEIGWRIGVVYMFGTLGMAIGGWLGGAIFDALSVYRPAFVVGLVFNAANLSIVGWLVLRQNRFGTRFVPA